MANKNSKRREDNSAKVNLILALLFHAVLIFAGFFWAAREGAFGLRLQEITVAIVPPEKEPEPEPVKIPKPIEQPPEEAKVQPVIPPPPQQTVSAPAPEPAVSMAPAPAVAPDFDFSDGAKQVITGTNAALISFKSQAEYALRSNWDRPSDMDDLGYEAEVELTLDPSGRITNYRFVKKSGNERWDESVSAAISTTRALNIPQPKEFNGKCLMRFDVVQTTTDLIVN